LCCLDMLRRVAGRTRATRSRQRFSAACGSREGRALQTLISRRIQSTVGTAHRCILLIASLVPFLARLANPDRCLDAHTQGAGQDSGLPAPPNLWFHIATPKNIPGRLRPHKKTDTITTSTPRERAVVAVISSSLLIWRLMAWRSLRHTLATLAGLHQANTQIKIKKVHSNMGHTAYRWRMERSFPTTIIC
jgi:hypothetical protein